MYFESIQQVQVKTLFSKCFTDGTLFYTSQIGVAIYSGFLRPGDRFDPERVRPRCWHGGTYGNSIEHWNVATFVENHKEYHKEKVKRLLDKDGRSCPSRLRKFRDFTFFE